MTKAIETEMINSLEQLDLDTLATLCRVANGMFASRRESRYIDLINKLCDTYNTLMREYPETAYEMPQPHKDDCALSSRVNAFKSIGPTMVSNRFYSEEFFEVIG